MERKGALSVNKKESAKWSAKWSANWSAKWREKENYFFKTKLKVERKV